MFDIAWSEMAVIGVVALVVIGPKDLPKVMRTMGVWSRKMSLLANDFRRHVDDMVRQAELDEIRKKAEEAAAPLKAEMEAMGDFAKDPIAPDSPPNVMHKTAAPAGDAVEAKTDPVRVDEVKPGVDPKPADSENSMANRGETRL
jgi:sec-independent protein translocase protein TatB